MTERLKVLISALRVAPTKALSRVWAGALFVNWLNTMTCG